MSKFYIRFQKGIIYGLRYATSTILKHNRIHIAYRAKFLKSRETDFVLLFLKTFLKDIGVHVLFPAYSVIVYTAASI